MTVKEYLIYCELKGAEDRLSKLQDMNAPVVMIEGQKKIVADLQNGKFVVSGDIHLLEEDYSGHEMRKGRGGKVYVVINGHINYFPNARYGRYIKEA